jgi:hypothetical protein
MEFGTPGKCFFGALLLYRVPYYLKLFKMIWTTALF